MLISREKTNKNALFLEKSLAVNFFCRTFAPAKTTHGPFVYRLGREIFIL